MDNKTNITTCALKLFAARGYDSVGVQEIVDTAGITKPTLYHYFGSKKGLFQALLNQFNDQLSELVKDAAIYQGDLVINLKKLTRIFFHFALNNQDYYRMQLALYFAAPDHEVNQLILKNNEKIHCLVEELFIKATKDHGNMHGRHKIYAATFIGMLNTIIGLFLNQYIEFNEELIDKSVHQFMHGIFS